MFVKIVALSSLATFVAALPSGATTVSQCNTTGHAQCCNVVGRYNDPSVTAVASHIGVAVTAVDAVVGLLCSPIGALEAGGVKCDKKPVCCQANQQNGVVNVQCLPINL